MEKISVVTINAEGKEVWNSCLPNLERFYEFERTTVELERKLRELEKITKGRTSPEKKPMFMAQEKYQALEEQFYKAFKEAEAIRLRIATNAVHFPKYHQAYLEHKEFYAKLSHEAWEAKRKQDELRELKEIYERQMADRMELAQREREARERANTDALDENFRGTPFA